MENPLSSKTKLDIFALPNQTTVLFLLITTVLLGTVVAGSIGTAPVLIWPLAVALSLLPIRAFLARPERDFTRYKLEFAGDKYSLLQEYLKTRAVEIGLRRTPKLVVSSINRTLGPYTFGTFRHWYIAVGEDVAEGLEADLKNPETALTPEAVLIHELYHFKTGDYWQLGYAGELLRLTFKVMAWAAAFFFGLGTLLLIAKPDIMTFEPSKMIAEANQVIAKMNEDIGINERAVIPEIPESLFDKKTEEVRQKAAGINYFRVVIFAVSATLPFVIMGFALWWYYWPKLWRTREFYADAGTVQCQREILPFRSALLNESLAEDKTSAFATSNAATEQRSEFQFWDRIVEPWQNLWDRVIESWETESRLKDKFSTVWQAITEPAPEYHPEWQLRVAAVKDPSRVFDGWAGTAVLVGILALMLELLLLNPLTFLHLAQWVMHFPTLAVLVIVSLNFLLPAIAQNHSTFKDTVKIIGVVMGLKLMVVLSVAVPLILQLIFAPVALSTMLEDIVAVVARFAGNSEDLAYDDLNAFVAKASVIAIAQVFFISVVLLLGLAGVAFLLQRLFRWYSFPQAERHLIRFAYGVIGGVSLFIAFNLLPFITAVVLPAVANLILALTANTSLSPDELPQSFHPILAVLGLIIIAVGVLLFIRTDRKYANRCPSCGEAISGPYELGKRCGACHKQLHPWLIAEYDT